MNILGFRITGFYSGTRLCSYSEHLWGIDWFYCQTSLCLLKFKMLIVEFSPYLRFLHSIKTWTVLSYSNQTDDLLQNQPPEILYFRFANISDSCRRLSSKYVPSSFFDPRFGFKSLICTYLICPWIQRWPALPPSLYSRARCHWITDSGQKLYHNEYF